MSLPGEKEARAELARRLSEPFARAERAHNAAVEVLTRGRLTISNGEGLNPGVALLIASLLTKACKTFRAIQLTTEGGLGQDASVLARQLFETAAAVRFILQKDTLLRATMFAAHQDQRALVLIEEASQIGLQSGSQENVDRQRARVKAWEVRLNDAEVLQAVRKHWSGQTLQWAAKQVDLGSAYTTMYRYTSAFAHGSDVGAHFFVEKDSAIPTLKLSPGDDEIRPVLDGAIALLGVVFESANERLGLGEEQVIARIKAECPQTADAT